MTHGVIQDIEKADIGCLTHELLDRLYPHYVHVEYSKILRGIKVTVKHGAFNLRTQKLIAIGGCIDLDIFCEDIEREFRRFRKGAR